MNFFTLELSKKLQEIGCVSKSGWYWHKSNTVLGKYFPLDHISNEGFEVYCQMFNWVDLCGPSERARENAKKLWPAMFVCSGCGELLEKEGCWGTQKRHSYSTSENYFHRHKITDLPEDEVEKYIWKTLGER